MQKLTIKNSEWLRGTDKVESGRFCAAGIAAEKNKQNFRRPIERLFPLTNFIDLLVDTMDINDDPATTDAEKIELLKPIFAAHGVEIEHREDE